MIVLSFQLVLIQVSWISSLQVDSDSRSVPWFLNPTYDNPTTEPILSTTNPNRLMAHPYTFLHANNMQSRENESGRHISTLTEVHSFCQIKLLISKLPVLFASVLSKLAKNANKTKHAKLQMRSKMQENANRCKFEECKCDQRQDAIHFLRLQSSR